MYKVIGLVSLICYSSLFLGSTCAAEELNNTGLNHTKVIKVTGTASVHYDDFVENTESNSRTAPKQSLQFPLLILVEETGLTVAKTKAVVENKLNIIAELAMSTGTPKDNVEESIQFFDLFIESFNLSKNSNFYVEGLVLDLPNHTNNHKGQSNNNHSVKKGSNNQIVVSSVNNNSPQAIKTGVKVSGEISVTLANEQAYYNFVDLLIKINVKDIKLLHKPLNQKHALYQTAVEKALINANKKAINIAEQLKGKLGGIISFEEISESPLLSNNNKAISRQFFDLNDSDYNKNNSTVAQVIVTFSFEQE